jgi:Tfp pilus assembly protein PilV
MVLERVSLDQLKAYELQMNKMAKDKNLRRSQAGITLVETMMAGAILVIGSLSMIGLIIDSIATNNRNKIDSTQTMLTEAILEQIDSTFIGSGSTDLIDCAGNTWTVSTAVPVSGIAGAALSGPAIDFTQTSPPAGYFMNYVVNNPCTTTGILQGTYDVRWHIDAVGSGATATSSYLLTVSAKLKNHGEGNMFFSLPVTLRVMSGN